MYFASFPRKLKMNLSLQNIYKMRNCFFHEIALLLNTPRSLGVTTGKIPED
jgi:hypothetical protein